MKLPPLVLALVSLCAAPASASVLTVGASGQAFTTIQAAVDAAVDGDVILVRTGNYASFIVDGKSLTIVGESVAAAPPVLVRNLPADRTVSLSSFTIVGLPLSVAASGIRITNCAGIVRVQDSLIRGVGGMPAAEITQSAQVSFSRCSISGATSFYTGGVPVPAGIGLSVTSSDVALYATSVTGGNGRNGVYLGMSNQLPTGDGVTGCIAGDNAHVFVSGGTLQGGKGGDGAGASCAPTPIPGGNGANGADALSLAATAHVDLHDSTLLPGAGGVGGAPGATCSLPGGNPGSAGMPVSGAIANLTVATGFHRGLAGTATVRELQSATLTFSGTPGDTVILVWARNPHHEFFPFFSGVITYSTPLRRLPMGMIPGSGTLTVNLAIADLGPGIESQLRYLQALFRDVSSQITLSDPMTLVLLDAAF